VSGALPPDGLRVLEAQLGRVRAMLYRYYELFFRFTGAGLVAVGALFIGAFWAPTQAAAMILPFVILYVGFHASYLFSYVIFARTFAAALEQRINREVGAELLVAHRLEEVYFGSPGDPRFVAASLRRPAAFISAETWHFTVVGAALFAVSVFMGSATVQRVGEPWSTWYVPVAIAWALLNGAYLAWHFLVRRDQRAIEGILADAYEPVAEPEGD
jgi:divalent metal cation (Fe/Co/Zn/Cd) transporter